MLDKYVHGVTYPHAKDIKNPSVQAALIVGARMAQILNRSEDYERLIESLV